MISVKHIASRFFDPDAYKRLYKKFLSLFVKLPLTPDPILIMTLLVKNEEDILEENLLFHKAMGVDGFIVTDNNSTDKTALILKKYWKKGWIKEIILETGDNYMQAVWVDRMIGLAKDKYKADWVINADADEFWYCKSENLKEEIARTRANVLKCRMRCVLPEPDKNFYQWEYIVNPVENPQKYDLSEYSIYNPQIPKVMHRTSGYLKIHAGNHFVDMKYMKEKYSDTVLIYHYSIRDLNHFTNKVILGGEALNKNPDKHMGVHCRYWYELYKQEKLPEEYRKIIGVSSFGLLKAEGIIRHDTTVFTFLSKLLKS